LRATTKKSVVNFFEEKSAPPDKILATPITWHTAVHLDSVSLRWQLSTIGLIKKAVTDAVPFP